MTETPPAPDPVLVRISEAVGRRDRAQLAAMWDELGDAGDPLHRCALAHHLADLQDDPRDELAWDLRALDAADAVTDERAAEAGVAASVAAFYPSLHLNLGDVYRRLGDTDRARHHLDAGRAAAGHLGDDGYGQLIRTGLDRLAERLT